MIVLCGTSVSNYYNKVKLVLLEKGLPFEEKLVKPGSAAEADSPLGKVPYIETPQGALSESAVIVDWLEANYPTPPLLPADAFQAAKLRELTTYLEMHMELAARQLYPQAFFNSPLPEKFTARVRPGIERAIDSVKRLSSFGPYIAGDTFTLADCSAYVHLPLVAMATRIVYGTDLVAAAGIDWKAYTKLIEQRPAAQRVAADRKIAQAAMLKKA